MWKLFALTSGFALLQLAAPAASTTLDAADILAAGGVGHSSVRVAGATVATDIGLLSVRGLSFAADAGRLADEVDVETLAIRFSGAPVTVQEIVLADLLSRDAARIVTDGDLARHCSSGCVASGSGDWSGPGSSESSGSVVRLIDPFGDSLVSSVSFSAEGRRSGFALVKIRFAAPVAVPEPTTAALMGVGLLGLTLLGRPDKRG